MIDNGLTRDLINMSEYDPYFQKEKGCCSSFYPQKSEKLETVRLTLFRSIKLNGNEVSR